ncbi:PD-(D/E)XK nuclease family protein [Aliivibrio fischeri]|uniref:PDDEXK-like family protein n=1 Tax=Aliivibrio fischeri TaxID=668 RepID=UPI001F1D95D8|nr:PD-(D/E)XK nuclease family protein [Aliivibrio fischeri]MCE4934478.1 PD-(D/E)XK nuclease family protein [Aliivibrio fischeri]
MRKKLEKLLYIPQILRERFQQRQSFNLFKVLRGSSDEVRLHSRFLAELLNPYGSHGKGSVFLKHFCNDVLRDTSFDLNAVTVEKEWNDIDILIRNQNGQAIIIENKVYAGDQDNQLNRYFKLVNDLNFNEDNIKLVYLSLYGKKASEQSVKGLNCDFLENNYQPISYKSHISSWLKNCRKEAVSHPELRESISQYLDLVAELTHTKQSDELMSELESWFEQELINKDSNPVALLDAVNVAKENFHAKKLHALQEAIVSRISSGVMINELESTSDFNGCVEVVARNNSFNIWLYPFNGENQGKLQVGFTSNHGTGYFNIWCSQQGDLAIYDCARRVLSVEHSSFNRNNKWSAGWKYLSDPIVLSESTDENLRKLSKDGYIEVLADKIANELNGLVLSMQSDSELKSLF